MSIVSQHLRLFYFNSPLGLDVLIANKFSGTEGISELFHYEIELASDDYTIQTEDLLGENVTLGIRQRDGVTFRYFNGQVSKFSPIRHDGRLAYYRAEVVPWVWFLTLSNGCQIYQDKTVPEIIQDTFAKYGYRDYDISGVKEEHKPWENCCQYMESAWDFVVRLMEMEGIFYYFTHEDGKHKLILVDNMASLYPCPYQSSFRYEHQIGVGEYRTEDTIFQADLHKVVKPNVYENNDYNFRIPTNKLKDWQHVQRDTGLPIDVSRRFYPANVEWPGEPQDYAKLRIEEQEHDHTVSSGSGNCRAMLPGFKFDLTDHDRTEQDINYLIIHVTHRATEGTMIAGSDKQEATYMNDFVAHPSSITFRPDIKTDEPRIDSLQTAFVVGPPGEEIYTDEYGRVRVKFFWDLTPGDDNGACSCWMRVMQPWAGPTYGQIWIPRVGMEVVVQFLNGDPDRPVITGCVYHAKNMPPYPLPPNKEWSGIKTRSTKGGTEDNYNEIRLVDSIGAELFRMQAEKDLHVFVKNDRSEYIMRDRFLDVGGDKHEQVDGDKYVTISKGVQEDVTKDFKVKIGGDSTLAVQGDQTEEIQGDKNITVDGDFKEDIQGDTSVHNEGDYDQKIDGDGKTTIDGDVDIKSNGTLVVEASDGLTIKCGDAFISIQGGIITIQGTKILLNCGGSADGADDADPDDPDTPDDFTNPDDPRFTSPAGDFPLPGDETDTEAASASGAGTGAAAGGAPNGGTGAAAGSAAGGAFDGGTGAAAGSAAGGASDGGTGAAAGSAAGGDMDGGTGAGTGADAGAASGFGGGQPQSGAPSLTLPPLPPLVSTSLANNPWVAQSGILSGGQSGGGFGSGPAGGTSDGGFGGGSDPAAGDAPISGSPSETPGDPFSGDGAA